MSLITATIVSLMAVGMGQEAQNAQAASIPASEVDEVVVVGTRQGEAAQRFVDEVSAPIDGRKLATWQGAVCVGASGLEADISQALADRVSDWAYSLGVRIHKPGCRPNIFVLVTDDAKMAAEEMVSARPRNFVTGAASSDRGPRALDAFRDSDRLIRWWQVSLPVNPDTGYAAVRVPGVPPPSFGEIRGPSDLGSWGINTFASRLIDETRDDLSSVTIIVDIRAFERGTFTQVADYISMVALAQIDPEAAPPTSSILNLFSDASDAPPSMSAWDQGYLRSLYESEQQSASPRANAAQVADRLAREVDGNDP
ncbi:MAG: hypothetical protein ACRED4_03160 [Brevundimonas sp.]